MKDQDTTSVIQEHTIAHLMELLRSVHTRLGHMQMLVEPRTYRMVTVLRKELATDLGRIQMKSIMSMATGDPLKIECFVPTTRGDTVVD
tara:strand:+ start:1204 stop:1470 length:267 start_codon:yes stop_codon:yes gene_type:complete